jgi:MoaA/NifB/PqqE/SkfB family radical SAM enzyme
MLEQSRLWKSRTTKHGVHFFERQTGINILLDEVRPPESSWAVAPRYVSVALTNACELSCPYCYASKKPARLGAKEINYWLTELDQNGCLGVGFGGGEPTLHSEFAKICRATADETGMAVSFTTHGHRISEELAKQLRGSVHFIRVSVDGIGQTYERNRGRTFGDLEKRIKLISGICRFGINVVVGDRTVWELDGLLECAERWGAEELLLLPEKAISGRAGIGELAYAEMTRWLASQRRHSSMRVGISRLADLSGIAIADAFPMEDPITAHAHIDADGGLRADAFTDTRIPIGGSVIKALKELRQAG